MNAKRILLLFLKIAVSGALVFWLLRKTDTGAIFHQIKTSHWRFSMLVLASIFLTNLARMALGEEPSFHPAGLGDDRENIVAAVQIVKGLM